MVINNEKNKISEIVKLTTREKECLYWASQGKTVEETAILLGISKSTVNSYLVKIRVKFNTPKIANAIFMASKCGLI